MEDDEKVGEYYQRASQTHRTQRRQFSKEDIKTVVAAIKERLAGRISDEEYEDFVRLLKSKTLG